MNKSSYAVYFSKLTIRKRIILFVVLPVVLATFILNSYLTLVRLDDADTTLSLRGELISGYLVIAAEYGLVTGDATSLQNLTDFTSRKPDIVKITIYDHERQIVTTANVPYQAVNANWFMALFLKDRKPITINKAVRISGFDVFDSLEDDFSGEISQSENVKIIGWVEIVISPRSLILQQQEIFSSSLFAAIFCLLLGILLSLQTERLVTRPILQLAKIVQSIRNGQFDMDSTGNLTGELGLLEQGLQEMAISLGEQNEHLREKVADATQELTSSISELELKNNQLETTQFEVIKASRAKEEFLARMSHEIRTPMNAVIGYATLLKQTQLEHDQHEYTRIIDRAAHQLLTVIDDILIFTKLESGAVSIENIQFDLQESLEDVVSMLSQSAHDKKLELVLLIYSDVPVLLKGDPIRINQILINLVNNAIKFTSEGSVVVHVEIGEETDAMVEILVSVDDSGPGIKPEQIEQLFEEFTQADSTITRRFGGTGLGLPIAKKLSELMHGRIGVESNIGEGSKFWFTVRCDKVSQENSPILVAGLQGKKILITDQNQYSVRSIRNNLLTWGMDVFTARNFTKSIDILRTAYDNKSEFDFAIFGLSLQDCNDKKFQSVCDQVRTTFDGPLLFLIGKEPQNVSIILDDSHNITLQRKPIARAALYNALCKQLNLLEVESGKSNVVNLSQANQVGRILVVEDNKFNRDLVTALLKKKGYDIYLAENANMALQIVQRQQFDIILMDIHLPDMSGLEAAKRIREIEVADVNQTTSTPIIALTADVFVNKSTLREATVVDCIIKPISETAFWQTLHKYLPKQQEPVSATIGPHVETNIELTLVQKKSLTINIKEILDDLSKLILNRELQSISEQIHQLKGLAGYYQFIGLSNIISDMEKSVSNTDYVNLTSLVKEALQINAEFE